METFDGPLLITVMNKTAKGVSHSHKKKWGKRISLTNAPFGKYLSPMPAIDKIKKLIIDKQPQIHFFHLLPKPLSFIPIPGKDQSPFS